MKKTNFLKIAFTLVMAFVITGAFAQLGTDVPGDGANFATNYETAGQETIGTTYLMEGTTIPLFALPDPYYHTVYDNNVPTNYNLHADGFTWTWTEATTTLTITQPLGAQDNYVTVGAAVGDAGAYTINVIEVAPAAWGGCSDNTVDEDITVNVVAQPTATLASTTAVNACEGGAALPGTVIATTADGWQNYRMVWTLEIATVDQATSLKDEYFDDEDGNGGVPGQKNVPESTTQAAPEVINGVAGGTVDIFTVVDFYVINSKPTVYTYTLVEINDQASRYGDFIGLGGDDTGGADTFNYYAIAAQQLVVTVNPSPNTGPIYHIHSTWAN